MSTQKIQELILDIAELDAVLSQLKRKRNIDAISLQKKRFETELTNLQAQSASEKLAKPASTADATPKRYQTEIMNYAWDQSDKFVKFFLSLDGVQNAPEENVVVTFTRNSIILKAIDIQNKDYKFEVNNLLHDIDVEKSYRKIKTNSIAIYAKKVNEGVHWSHLTTTEKRLADIKTAEINTDVNASKDDPTAGLMNIMKSMYEKGDPETKRMIAKAWTEGQEKKGLGAGMGGMDLDL